MLDASPKFFTADQESMCCFSSVTPMATDAHRVKLTCSLACPVQTIPHPPVQYLENICWVPRLSVQWGQWDWGPCFLTCLLIYDQSQLDRTDKWSPEAWTGQKAARGISGGSWDRWRQAGGCIQLWAIREKMCLCLLCCGGDIGRLFLIHYHQALLQVVLCRHTEQRVCQDVTDWVCAQRIWARVCELSS